MNPGGRVSDETSRTRDTVVGGHGSRRLLVRLSVGVGLHAVGPVLQTTLGQRLVVIVRLVFLPSPGSCPS